MSIALDESTKYGDDHFYAPAPPEVLGEAYYTGRTATATEEEIEAVAREFYRSFMAAFCDLFKMVSDDDGVDWDGLTDEGRNRYREYAAQMLSAARKQVTDE